MTLGVHSYGLTDRNSLATSPDVRVLWAAGCDLFGAALSELFSYIQLSATTEQLD